MRIPPLESIRLVVLDMDGTLVDAFEDIRQATLYAMQAAGCSAPLDLATLMSYVGNGVHKLIARALKTSEPPLVERAVAAWREYSTAHPAEHAHAYPGAHVLLETLGRHGIKRAVLSNKPHEATVQVAERLGLCPLLDEVWGERPEHPVKPDPGALRELMERFSTTPAETILVGDGAPDIEAARAAGVWSCGVTWGLGSREGLLALGADMIVDSLDDLRAAFERAI